MRLAALLAALALAGCANTASAPKAPAAAVAAAEASLAAAGQVALSYMRLPPCGGGTQLCSATALKAQIKAAYDAAYEAVVAAQAIVDSGGTPDMTKVQSALTSLQNIVTMLPKGN